MPDIKSVLIWALGASLVALVAALFWGMEERERGASARKELAQFREKAEKARADAEGLERRKELRWTEKTMEAAANAQSQINALEGDLARARGAAERLRIAAAGAARRASEAPKPADPGPREPDTNPLDLLVAVLDRHSQELVRVGDYADRLRIAGEACERAWEVTR